MLWKAFWALVFGYIISAGIQVLVTREQMANVLGKRRMKQAGLASFFGFISSSCSFAALAASHSVLVKGAHPANALAFLIASTNLVIELGIVLWILLGWHFFMGNILLGVLMIVYAYTLTKLGFPYHLADRARHHAEEQQQSEGMMHGQGALLWGKNWRDKLAFFTFIGSMGNVPLAAMLWSKNASFGGVMAFLGADLVAATVIYVHAKYYG